VLTLGLFGIAAAAGLETNVTIGALALLQAALYVFYFGLMIRAMRVTT
jgi:hypothetical protein